jgi:hypothetical protein
MRCWGAGVDERHLFEDRASGARDDRPGLAACLAHLRPGDTVVVWKLDRLGRSLPHLLDVVTGLRERSVAFHSLTEGMDTTTPHGELLFHIFGCPGSIRASIDPGTGAGGTGCRAPSWTTWRPPGGGATGEDGSCDQGARWRDE